MSDNYKFTLRANGYHLNIRTIDVGVPVTSGEAPGPNEVDIEGTILNPNMFNYQMPTQETPDSSWSVSPLSILLPGEDPSSFPPTIDGGDPPAIDGDFVYGRRPVIDVGAGKYSRAVSDYTVLSTVNPTDIVSNVAEDGFTNKRIIAKECSVSEYDSATYSPVSVVSFESCADFNPLDEWYRDEEYGWYLLKTDVDSFMQNDESQGNTWWWDTVDSPYKGSAFGTRGGIYCRYNPSSGGYSPPVTGTFDDTIFEEPGAVLDVTNKLSTSHPLGPPSNYRWFWCRFIKGGPSDFPVGQRLRCTSETYLANGSELISDGLTDVKGEFVGDGQYKLDVESPGGASPWDRAPPYPWPPDIPWPVDGSSYGQTSGRIEDTNLFKLYFKIRLEKL